MFDSKSLLFNLCLMKYFICVYDMLTLILLTPDVSAFGTSVDGDQQIKIKTIFHKAYDSVKINLIIQSYWLENRLRSIVQYLI